MLSLKMFRWVLCVLLSLGVATLAQAQSSGSSGDVRTTSALRFAPADSAFFYNSLNMKNRVERFWKTKAVQQAWKTPLVQAGWTEVTKQWKENSGPFQEMLKQPENQQLLELLGDMVSEEFFILGGKSTPRFFSALANGIGAAQFAPLQRLFGQGGDENKLRVRAFLHGLMEHKSDLLTPELILGFKIRDEKVALQQVARLEVLLNGAAMAVPQLTGKVKRQKLGDLSFATVTLDGSTVKWDELPWDQIEEEKGEFEALIGHLKRMKMTISLGNYQGYLLLAFGDSLSVIERLGKGKKLAELAEFQPLAKHVSKPIIGVGYASKETNANSSFTRKDADDLQEMLMSYLEDGNLPDDLHRRLEKDIPEFVNDVYKLLARDAGPSVTFTYETPRGEESFSYVYSVDPSVDASKPLSILNHVGGDPVAAIVGRSAYRPEDWNLVVKWCKKGDGYVNDFVLPQLGKEEQEKTKKLLSALYPLFHRFDQVTREKLIPALRDGQFAFVVDNKLSSTQWHKDMPVSKSPLPLLEPALVLGVSDADKLSAAASDYRRIVNDGIKAVNELDLGETVEFTWPEPESRSVAGGRLYWYAFPDELMLDGRLAPTAGLSTSMAALTVSNEHALRLLKNAPLAGASGPLADLQQQRGGAAVLNMAALVETAQPWVDYALTLEDVDKEVAQHRQDIKTILNSLKIFRRYSSSMYVENGATVTHSEWQLRDID